MKRILCSLSVFPIAALIAWCGGYDFDKRGFWLAYGVGCSIFFAYLIYSYPGWPEKK